MTASEPSKGLLWVSRVASAVPVLMLAASGAMKVARHPAVLESFTARFGFGAEVVVPIGMLELGCTLLYLVPRTAVLGAVLLTGYLGGAAVTHVRVGELAVALAPVLLGVLLWGGLFLRDERIRALLPLRRNN